MQVVNLMEPKCALGYVPMKHKEIKTRDFLAYHYPTLKFISMDTEEEKSLVMAPDNKVLMKLQINSENYPVNILARIKYRGLPEVYWGFKEDGKSYLIEEYVCGHSLEELLRARIVLREYEIKEIFFDVLASLDMLRYHRISHGRINLKNIVVQSHSYNTKLLNAGFGNSIHKDLQDLGSVIESFLQGRITVLWEKVIAACKEKRPSLEKIKKRLREV